METWTKWIDRYHILEHGRLCQTETCDYAWHVPRLHALARKQGANEATAAGEIVRSKSQPHELFSVVYKEIL